MTKPSKYFHVNCGVFKKEVFFVCVLYSFDDTNFLYLLKDEKIYTVLLCSVQQKKRVDAKRRREGLYT